MTTASSSGDERNFSLAQTQIPIAGRIFQGKDSGMFVMLFFPLDCCQKCFHRQDIEPVGVLV